jgi:hypothetical protein
VLLALHWLAKTSSVSPSRRLNGLNHRHRRVYRAQSISTRTKRLLAKTILRLSLESDGMAAGSTTILVTRICGINRGLKTLVSGYDRGSSPLSLTSTLAVPSGRVALVLQDLNFDNFEDIPFFIPPDCPTSTPVASRKRASSPDSGATALARVSPSLEMTRGESSSVSDVRRGAVKSTRRDVRSYAQVKRAK